MAKSISGKFYPNATATCMNCKSVYTLGLSVEKLNLDICGNCHPFYTGQQTMIDTAGMIEKYQARLSKSQATTATKTKKVKKRRFKNTLADLISEETTTNETQPVEATETN